MRYSFRTNLFHTEHTSAYDHKIRVSVQISYSEGEKEWPSGSQATSLTMPARVKTVFMNFCSLFSFFGHTIPFTPKSGLICSVKLCFDDHGSFVIFRSVSVRPRHLIDQNFDHDYFFKLPLQGAGCPITSAVC